MGDMQAFLFEKLSPCCLWEESEWRETGSVCVWVQERKRGLHGNSSYHHWSSDYYLLPSVQPFISNLVYFWIASLKQEMEKFGMG